MKSRSSVLFALTLLIATSLACKLLNGDQSTPIEASPISNVYLANDPEGLNKTNVFAPKEAIYIFFDADAAEIGTYFEARWYVLDKPDVMDPTVPFTTSNYTYNGGSKTVHAFIQSSHPDGFPSTQCKVEIYMDGVKVAEQLFTIR
ncbi:MAG: hypothetical protein HS100_14270 [Anaerolineales bacterium]|nr:hypothetical protein [Anaerolineales bacterium]